MFFFVERILSCLVMIQSDWMDWYFQTIARVKNRSCFRIMAVTVGAEFLSSLNKTWRQFSQFNLFQRAPKIYPWVPLVTIISEPSMCKTTNSKYFAHVHATCVCLFLVFLPLSLKVFSLRVVAQCECLNDFCWVARALGTRDYRILAKTTQ